MIKFNNDAFNGFTVLEVSRTFTGIRNELATVPGRDGSVFLGATRSTNSIVVRFIFSGTRQKRGEMVRMLASKLLYTELKKLEFSEDNGLYYMAIVDGQPDFLEFVRTGKIDVTFLVPDPAMYGAVKTATVPSGGSTTITVGGTVPTYPAVSATATRSTSTNLWGLRIDDKDYMRIDTGSNAARVVKIDVEQRTAAVSNTAAMITTDSDWIILTPGSHKIANDQGTGAATLTWTERWL